MGTLSAKEKNLLALDQKVDGINTRIASLIASADDLTRKQTELETLNERLGRVDELAKKTSWQMDALKQSRHDLDALKKEVQDFYKSHAEIAQLRDKLGADRQALEAFGERVAAMQTRAPELEAKMDAILGKMTLVEEGTQKATRLGEAIAEQIGRAHV